MKPSKFLFAVAFVVCSISSLRAQQTAPSRLENDMKNKNLKSIRINTEDEKIPEFVSRLRDFEFLETIHFERYANTAQAKLVLAALSGLDNIKVLDFELNSFNKIPPYLDQFEGIEKITISDFSPELSTKKPFNIILKNGSKNFLVEIKADNTIALNYMDLFFKTYPEMAQIVHDFVFYPLRSDLTRAPSNYNSFQSLYLPQSSSIKIDPTHKAAFVSRDGSFIQIPAYAFIDAEGTSVRDSVQIDFTYLQDQLDIALAGIGMETMINNEATLLQSAGMFEINASKNGQQLSLAENMSIDIEMSSSDGGKYNIYSWDDAVGTWLNEIEDNVPMQSQSIFSPAYYKFNDLYNDISISARPNQIFDESAEYFLSPEYIRFSRRADTEWKTYNLAVEEDRRALSHQYKREAKRKNSAESLLTFKRKSSESKSLKNHVFFEINDLNNSFSELKPLKKHVWYTLEPTTNSDFKNQFSNHKTYVDFRLNYNQKTESFQIFLKDVTGDFDTINALPFLEESKLIETKSLVHQDILEDYQNAFSSIVSRFNRQKEALEKKYHRAYNKRLKKQTALERKAWEKTKPLMSAAENQMTFEQWFAYFDNLRMAELETSMASSNNAAVLLRSFRIGRLGYWNCDNPMLQKSRFENVRILAQEATSNDYLVSALFLDFNAAFSTDKMSKIDTKGDCAYIIINGEYISWITPKEAEISDKKTIISERPFEHIRDVNIEQLRNDLLAGNF